MGKRSEPLQAAPFGEQQEVNEINSIECAECKQIVGHSGPWWSSRSRPENCGRYNISGSIACGRPGGYRIARFGR